MEQSLKTKAANGVLWSGIDKFASQGIQFLLSVIIARILLPSDFGTIALLNVFLAICQTFIDSGFGLALMRKKECTEDDFNTVFIFSVVVAGICYALLWVGAPLIASFYDLPILIDITRIVALNVIINAFSNVPNAKLSISLDFKKKAYASLVTVLFSGTIGLWMAYNGLGVWALVYQTLIASCIRTILLFVCTRWLPIMTFSMQSFNELFMFGSKMLISGIIGNIYNNLSSIMIGKFYSPSLLGLYGKANTFASYPSMNMTGVILNVAYPVLAKIQDDEIRLINAYRKILKVSTFIIFPLMIGLFAVSGPFVRYVLGDKWIEMIPLLQILCLVMMWEPVNGLNLNLLQVKGYAKLFLKLEIIKKTYGVLVLIITIPFGLKMICYGMLFVTILNLFINTYYTRKYFCYGLIEQLKDLCPILIHSVIMGSVTMGAICFFDSSLNQLLLGISIGILYYLLIGLLFKFEELFIILNYIKQRT